MATEVMYQSLRPSFNSSGPVSKGRPDSHELLHKFLKTLTTESELLVH